MTLPLGRLESAAKRLDLETERPRQKKERLGRKCAKRLLIVLVAVDHAMSLTPRLVQRIGLELHAVRCFSVELQACSASANVVKGEPAILIALRLR